MSGQTTINGRVRELDGEKKPTLEQVVKCEWPVNCRFDASFNVIDFGFNPPIIWKMCESHANAMTKMKAHAIKEPLRL